MRNRIPFAVLSFLILTLVLALMACSSQPNTEESILPTHLTLDEEDPEVLHILMTHTENTESVTHQTALYLGERLDKYSGGTMKLSVYGDNSLGNLGGSVSSLALGTTQMRIGTTGAPLMTVFRWLPTLCDATTEQMTAALQKDKPLRKMLEKDCLDRGYRLLESLPISYRVITSNTPLNTVEDFGKLKMRTIFNGMESDYWALLGAETSAFEVDKVYLALQQDYVNAQENTIPSILSNRFYEQQKYVTLIKHRVYLDQIYVNEEFYQSLTDQQKKWLKKAVTDAKNYGSLQMSYYADAGLNQLADCGLTVNYFAENERTRLMEILRPYAYEALTASYGTEMVDQLIEYVTESPH